MCVAKKKKRRWDRTLCVKWLILIFNRFALFTYGVCVCVCVCASLCGSVCVCMSVYMRVDSLWAIRVGRKREGENEWCSGISFSHKTVCYREIVCDVILRTKCLPCQTHGLHWACDSARGNKLIHLLNKQPLIDTTVVFVVYGRWTVLWSVDNLHCCSRWSYIVTMESTYDCVDYLYFRLYSIQANYLSVSVKKM